MREPIAYTEYLTITTDRRYEIVDITEQVERVCETSKLADGYILVSTMHITSSIFVNDRESGLYQDIMQWLEELAPAKPEYKHHLSVIKSSFRQPAGVWISAPGNAYTTANSMAAVRNAF